MVTILLFDMVDCVVEQVVVDGGGGWTWTALVVDDLGKEILVGGGLVMGVDLGGADEEVDVDDDDEACFEGIG